MRLFSRREFLKSLVALLGTSALVMPLVEALEIRRRGLEIGTVKAGTPQALPAPESEADALRFCIIGDWGWAGIDRNPDPKVEAENVAKARGELSVAKAMGELAAAHHPQFVLNVGDNFYPSGVDSADDPRWEISFEKPFAAPALQVPWQCAVGNHDYRKSIPAQIDYSRKSRRWRLPSRYYSFKQKSPAGVTAEFFVMDTNPFAKGLHAGGHSDVAKQDTGAQLAWLDKALGESDAHWKIIVGHHPIWTGGVKRDVHETNFDAILPPLMKKHGVRVYICGHEHDAQHIVRDGLQQVLHGNGGDMQPTGTTVGTVFAESRPGFGYALLTKDELKVYWTDTAGQVRHTAVVSHAE